MSKLKIAVLSGGISNEREVSLNTAEQILSNIPKDKYEVFKVDVNSDLKWIEELKNNKPDVAFIALHGKFGEDGRTQAVLEYLGIKYTGSGVLSSAFGMDKIRCSDFLSHSGLNIPKIVSFQKGVDFNEALSVVKEKISFPCVVKPNESGSSVGVTICQNEDMFEQGLENAFKEDDLVLVEQYIKGQELTSGVLGNTGGELLALPPIEIIPHKQFFDYAAKYQKESDEICPANISEELTKEVQQASVLAHKLLGCRGLTRTDFIFDGQKLFFLEINTLPGQTKESLCPKEASAIGLSFAEFLEKQIQLALE
ncbi:MAG: D-alanine--D-alanine ligase family protein [Candidatus Doudnabacteria bacterium]